MDAGSADGKLLHKRRIVYKLSSSKPHFHYTSVSFILHELLAEVLMKIPQTPSVEFFILTWGECIACFAYHRLDRSRLAVITMLLICFRVRSPSNSPTGLRTFLPEKLEIEEALDEPMNYDYRIISLLKFFFVLQLESRLRELRLRS